MVGVLDHLSYFILFLPLLLCYQVKPQCGDDGHKLTKVVSTVTEPEEDVFGAQEMLKVSVRILMNFLRDGVPHWEIPHTCWLAEIITAG